MPRFDEHDGVEQPSDGHSTHDRQREVLALVHHMQFDHLEINSKCLDWNTRLSHKYPTNNCDIPNSSFLTGWSSVFIQLFPPTRCNHPLAHFPSHAHLRPWTSSSFLFNSTLPLLTSPVLFLTTTHPALPIPVVPPTTQAARPNSPGSSFPPRSST